VCCCGNSIHWNAAVDDHAIIDCKVIDDSRAIKNSGGFRRGQMAMAKVAMGEIVQGDECEAIGPQTEVEVETYSHAVESPTESDIKHRMRRHGRPTAKICG
jgi:hypothetical protein